MWLLTVPSLTTRCSAISELGQAGGDGGEHYGLARREAGGQRPKQRGAVGQDDVGTELFGETATVSETAPRHG
ncbi:hypothetical protein ACWDKQ_02255 [Saccharopolyspora sp. NPDC000995]